MKAAHSLAVSHARALHRNVRVALACVALVLAMLATGVSAQPAESATLSNTLVPSSGALFGVFSGPPRNGRTWGQEMPYLESLIGRKYDLDSMYYFWEETFPGWHERDAVAAGRIPVILWASDYKRGGSLSWAAIANGQHDAVIDARADALKAFGSKVMLVFQHEPEDDHDTNGTAAEYRAAYRHVVTRMRARGASNVVFVWNLMAWTFNAGAPEPEDYYPGDDVVDWVAADGYNWYGSTFNPGPWRSFAEIFRGFYEWSKRRGKPLLIVEFGSGEDSADRSRKARWFEEAAAQLKAWPEIKGVIYFHSLGWEFDSSPNALEGYRAMGRDPYFNALAIARDTVVPSAKITAPSAGATVSGTVTVAAEASDNVGVARLELRVDGLLAGTDTRPPYEFQWDANGVSAATAELEVRAFDEAGNYASSGKVTVALTRPAADTTRTPPPAGPAPGAPPIETAPPGPSSGSPRPTSVVTVTLSPDGRVLFSRRPRAGRTRFVFRNTSATAGRLTVSGAGRRAQTRTVHAGRRGALALTLRAGATYRASFRALGKRRAAAKVFRPR